MDQHFCLSIDIGISCIGDWLVGFYGISTFCIGELRKQEHRIEMLTNHKKQKESEERKHGKKKANDVAVQYISHYAMRKQSERRKSESEILCNVVYLVSTCEKQNQIYFNFCFFFVFFLRKEIR